MEICYIMNKEETLNNLKAYLDGDTAIGNIIPLRSILESAIKYLEPSLPSNIDKAAEKFNREDAARMWDYEGKTEGEIVDAAFKAGAEWMAGQGETIECSVGWYDGPFLDFSEEQLYSAIVKAEIEVGDKVVVQIRKK